MNDKGFSNKLDSDSKFREEMLDDAIRSIENISNKKIADENILQQYKIDEIKYKTTINELNEYIEIYKNKLETLEKESSDNEKEVMTLRKKVLKDETDISTLKSILDLFVKEYGIDTIVKITKLDRNKIESYIEE